MGASYPSFATTDAGRELAVRGAVEVTVTVTGQSALASIGRGTPAIFGEEEELIPGVHVLGRACDAIQIRSRAVGLSAVVSVSSRREEEI